MTPQKPRLLDPANPANNLFDTGFYTTRTGDKSHDEKEGNWSEIKIETIDLTVDIIIEYYTHYQLFSYKNYR